MTILSSHGELILLKLRTLFFKKVVGRTVLGNFYLVGKLVGKGWLFCRAEFESFSQDLCLTWKECLCFY